jgi:hypothetical protein
LGNLKNAQKTPWGNAWGNMRFERGRFQPLRGASSPHTSARQSQRRSAAIDEHIVIRRADEGFQKRLRKQLEDERAILERF